MEFSEDFGSPAAARWAGMMAALGMPALVLGASYVGFGALIRQSGLTLPQGLSSTVIGWALPGQIALVEVYATGGTLLAATLAVALANARLLPMVLTLMPLLRAADGAGRLKPRHFIAAHFIAITGWAITMQRAPAMPPAQRLPFFAGFTVALWVATMFCTALGFMLVGMIPSYVTLGLVFINPLYFMLIFLADFKHRNRALALAFGAVLGPIFYLVDPDWGLLATGIIAGTFAFAIDRRLEARAELEARDELAGRDE
jgi:predicted branched-subunit amino acid permease